ncbi:hypothetical protein FH972_021517 [Carpinus fangiana]|uniref:ABC-type xenobiotic transporter n=1 Tax=Carpinus fangiana TaxID=176857 RepID=A0A5N6KQ60_9ROSI|nr:hypothetical protein FH972_021517 [Carpinus fangiana]
MRVQATQDSSFGRWFEKGKALRPRRAAWRISKRESQMPSEVVARSLRLSDQTSELAVTYALQCMPHAAAASSAVYLTTFLRNQTALPALLAHSCCLAVSCCPLAHCHVVCPVAITIRPLAVAVPLSSRCCILRDHAQDVVGAADATNAAEPSANLEVERTAELFDDAQPNRLEHQLHAREDHLNPSDHDRRESEEEHEELKAEKESRRYTKDLGMRRTTSSATDATDVSTDLDKTPSYTHAAKRPWYSWPLFKSRTIPPVPKQRVVSREHSASLLSRATFQWMTPIMNVGYQRPLELNDIWLVNPNRSTTVLADKVQASFKMRVERGDKRPLIGAMHEIFFMEFWFGGICQLISSVLQVVTPFVLRYLIEFAGEAYAAQQNPNLSAPHIGRGVGLVVGITILQAIQSFGTNQFIYRGMVLGGQSRSVLIALIFDKSVRISGRARAGGRALNAADPSKTDEDLKPPEGTKPGSKEEKKWFKLKFAKSDKKAKQDKKDKKSGDNADGVLGDGQGYGNGRIINLMSVDTARIDTSLGMFHMTWTSPISIVITLVLLLINITYSALSGFGLLVLSMPLLSIAIRSLFYRRKEINKMTDNRVSLTQEILQAVRFVKYFGWETSFLERVGKVRTQEIRAIQWLMAVRNGINAISMSMPIFASMLAFITYALSGHGLGAGRIFSSLALFNALRLPLNLLPMVIGQVVDAASSIGRIEQFLLAEEALDEAVWDTTKENAIEMAGASFTWERSPGKDNEKDNGDTKAAVGTTQPDKTALKGAEAEKTASAPLPNSPSVASSSDEKGVPVDQHTVNDSSSTLLDDTPFAIQGLDFQVGRKELIAVIGGVGSGKSSLLAALAGDMRRTEGTVTLAASRAFCPQYAWIQNDTLKNNILFGKDYDRKWYNAVIDACALRPDLDMLPNGDQTEIGERGITVSGGQKQRLNIARAIYHDSDIVLMDDPLSAVDAHVGRHIMDEAICGLLHDKCRILATHQLWVLNRCDRIIWMHEGRICDIGTFDDLMSRNPDFVKLIANNAQEDKQEEADHVDEDEVEGEKKLQKKQKRSKKPAAALMQTEERAVSNVSASVYAAYVRASGGMWVLPLVIILLVTSQGANIATSLWLSWWTSDKFGYSTGAYIGIYAALGVAQALLMFIFSIALSFFGTEASKVMLHRAIVSVLRAPMSFFDTTPLGRITNRFSKDIDTMDNLLSESIRFFCLTMGMILSVFILIIAYYYFFAVALVPLLVVFLFSSGFYRASAREIKRHEAVLRSHVYARFSEAVTGIATIRAYGLEKRFSTSIRDAVDDMASAYYLTFSNQRWLSVRLDTIGILLVFTVGILVVTSRFAVNPSTGGLVLSYILSIVQMIQFTVRQLAEVENNMNSTERIHYYGTHLEEEAALHGVQVPDEWPQAGAIDFEDVQMRYRQGLPLVLKGLDLKVRGGERIGVVGRTGAGKSSIMSTLFRLVELSGGSIKIDGIDISTVGLQDLRSRLAIIPQDPTLFKGTVRSNLDPFGRYTDLELWSALRQADLVEDDREMEDKSGRIHLDSAVDEEGLNFSLGQRQLMALARALVRGSRIIVCDEATSSVDMDTDQKIQRTIQRGFKGKTLLCIAHRLRTIIDYDRIIVMDQGTIAECDTPIALWKQGGIFRGMCDRSSIREEDFGRSLE